MAEAYIIDTIRTPVGKRGGSLSQIHPADLGAHTLKALMDRTELRRTDEGTEVVMWRRVGLERTATAPA